MLRITRHRWISKGPSTSQWQEPFLRSSGFDQLANIINEKMHDHIARRVFLTAIGHALDAAAVGGMPFLIVRIVGDQRNRLARKPAGQPIASLCKMPNLFKILLADAGFQSLLGYRFFGRTVVVCPRWNMQVNLFRAVQQKGKFVWPHPSHVSLLPKLIVLQHNYDSASAVRGNGGYERALAGTPIFRDRHHVGFQQVLKIAGGTQRNGSQRLSQPVCLRWRKAAPASLADCSIKATNE
ncbi:conserved hypothetical protein [Agrobacterium fabacearum S56]|nr:conserved hypothetical protein [Agrobacterium fabacearum S56]